MSGKSDRMSWLTRVSTFSSREIKPEIVRPHERAFLLHMGAQDYAKGLVQQVRAGMVVLDMAPAAVVHHQGEGLRAARRQALGQVDGKVVLLHRVQDLDALAVFALDEAGVTHLAAHFGVEGGAVENQLEVFLVFLFDGTLFQQVGAIDAERVVAFKDHVGLFEHHPVSEFVGGGVAGTLFLLLELYVEAVQVYLIAFFRGNQLRQVDGKAVSVVQDEGIRTGHRLGGGVFGHVVFQHANTPVQGTQEGVFFFLDDAGNQFLLGFQFGIGVSHIGHQLGNEAAEEGLAETQEGVAVPDRAAQDAADDVAGLYIGRQLAVGDGEGNGADVVGDDAHGHFHVAAFGIFVSGKLFNLADKAGEDIRFVVALLPLHDHAQAFESHAGVDAFGGEGAQVAVGHAVVLHEHEVPDFNHLVVVGVHQGGAGDLGAFFFAAQVDMDFAAGTAGTRIAHLPEIVVLVAQQDVVLRQVAQPRAAGVLVQGGAVGFVALEDGGVEDGSIDLVHLGQQLPCPINGLVFEIVAETPVAQHLEHGMVAAVMSDGFQVVVFAAHAQAFLCIGCTGKLGSGVAQEDVLELVHARVRKHQGGVVLDYHRCRGYHRMPFGGEEVQVLLAYFFRCHHLFGIIFDKYRAQKY